MILYCDTSALLKLDIAEPGADQMAKQAAACDVLAVNRIAWIEAHAAFARRTRQQPAAANQLDMARQRLVAQWPDFLTLELTTALAAQAARYADGFALRADDSVQLACAQGLQAAQADPVVFACFDLRLNRAAATLGLATLG